MDQLTLFNKIYLIIQVVYLFAAIAMIGMTSVVIDELKKLNKDKL